MSPDKPEVVGPGGGEFKMPNIEFKMPGKFRIALIAGLLLFVGVAVALRTCFTYIRPYETGIKQVKLGLNKGMQAKIYTPGLAFQIPGIEIIHRFPNQLQVLDLTDTPSPVQLRSHTTTNAARIQTSDGFYVDVDVSILYHIVDAYKLIKTLGPGQNYLYQGIIPKAEPFLKESLGQLATEDFYNSPLRVEKAEQTRELLNTELSAYGIQVDEVLVRYFKYTPEIQENIEEKKLQDQLVFKNQSEKRAAIEDAKLIKVTQEGMMNVKITMEEGSAYRVKKDAEMELYRRSLRAEADLLVSLAEAKRTELRNEAMQAVGADKAVAMKMAEVLNGLQSIIIPIGGPDGFNPLDLNQMTKLFGVTSATDSPAGGGIQPTRRASEEEAGQ